MLERLKTKSIKFLFQLLQSRSLFSKTFNRESLLQTSKAATLKLICNVKMLVLILNMMYRQKYMEQERF